MQKINLHILGELRVLVRVSPQSHGVSFATSNVSSDDYELLFT